MGIKIEFVERFSSLSNKLSAQRIDALRNHLENTLKQHEMSKIIEDAEAAKAKSQKKIKFKSGFGPSKDRQIFGERFKLTFEQINEIRKYSHYFCQNNLQKIDVEQKEKTQKLMLPLIKGKTNRAK